MANLDDIERAIINQWQGGFPVCEQPYLHMANSLGIEEGELLERLQQMQDQGLLTRFGPLYNIEQLGGTFCLAAMQVPDDEFSTVVRQVNAHPEVAHNYRRDHRFNMWFVLATETERDIEETAGLIVAETGYTVYLFPKLQEDFVELKLTA